MNYTIAVLEECNMGEGKLRLNIDRSGNQYLVGLLNTDTHEYSYRVFDTIDTAYIVFSTLSEWIIKSLYSEDKKREYLTDMTV